MFDSSHILVIKSFVFIYRSFFDAGLIFMNWSVFTFFNEYYVWMNHWAVPFSKLLKVLILFKPKISDVGKWGALEGDTDPQTTLLLHFLWGWFKKTTTKTSGKTNGKFTMNVMKVQTLTFCNPSLQLCPNPWSAASDNLCFFERKKKFWLVFNAFHCNDINTAV